MTGSETASALIARLRTVTVADAAEALADTQVSDPLSAEDVFAFYNSDRERPRGWKSDIRG